MLSAFHSTRVITPTGVIEATLILADGKIQDVLPGRVEQGGIPFESVGNKVIMPGVIDAHVHINEPGRTEWEGFETATRAAAAGGITTLIEMPLNASPVTTTVDAFMLKLEAAKGKLHVNVGFYGGVIPSNIDDLDALLNAGVFGIKAFLTHSGIDEFPNVTEAALRKALPFLKNHDAKLLVHCELESPSTVTPSAVEALPPSSYQRYLTSRPAVWETDAIALMIRLSEEFDVHIHIVHVSSAEALPLIRDAKKRGLRITAETCPHYLVFYAEEVPDGATEFKCAPPIRERANNELLWEALKDGTLDFVATDHSPAPPDIKEQQSGDFMKAWGGIAGLQFGLSAFWTGAKERGFSLEDVARLLCEHPAQFLGMKQKGRIAPGCDADLVIWDPEASFVVKEADIQHRHKLTPYAGRTLHGKVERTFVNGLTMRHGQADGCVLFGLAPVGKEQEFMDRIDCCLPYNDQDGMKRLINEARAISANASYAVLEEVCRLPAEQRAVVTSPRQLELLDMLETSFEHPFKTQLFEVARRMVADQLLSVKETKDLMLRLKQYHGQWAALNVLYFANGVDASEIEDLDAEIRASWR